jgi:hypothetical protein
VEKLIHRDMQISIDKFVQYPRCFYYPLANKVAKRYSNATVRPSVTSL